MAPYCNTGGTPRKRRRRPMNPKQRITGNRKRRKLQPKRVGCSVRGSGKCSHCGQKKKTKAKKSNRAGGVFALFYKSVNDNVKRQNLMPRSPRNPNRQPSIMRRAKQCWNCLTEEQKQDFARKVNKPYKGKDNSCQGTYPPPPPPQGPSCPPPSSSPPPPGQYHGLRNFEGIRTFSPPVNVDDEIQTLLQTRGSNSGYQDSYWYLNHIRNNGSMSPRRFP